MRRSVLLGLVIWVAALGYWAMQPLVDHVPTGIVEDAPTAQAVDCHAPLSGDDSPAEPLPTVEPPRAYSREACEEIHAEAMVVLAGNVMALALAGVGAVAWRRRTSRRSQPASDAPAAAGEPAPQSD